MNAPTTVNENTQPTFFREVHLQRPLLPIAVAVILGMSAGACRPGCIWTLGGATLFLFVGAIPALLLRRAIFILPVLLCVALGYLSIQPWLGVQLPGNHVRRYVDQGLWQIQGCVQSALLEKRQRWEFMLETTLLQQGANRYPVCGRIKVTGRGRPPELMRDDRVTLKGHLRAIRNFSNPGGFDYERFMALRQVHARVYARRGSLKRITPAAAQQWRDHVDRVRKTLAHQMESALTDYPGDSVAVLQALVLGERRKMTDELRKAYSRAGAGHILAISGLHIGFVAAASFAFAKWLLGWIPLMLRHAWTRKGATVLSFLVVTCYGILAGLSPSTQRAMIMVSVFLLGFWIGRKHDWLNTLALAAMIVLIAHPPTLLSISFQLSFAAVLAIIAGMRVLEFRRNPSDTNWWLRLAYRLLSFLWVSALAIAGTLPLVLFYFNEVSLVGLLTNLIVVPVVAMVVVPAGLTGVLVSFLEADLAALCWQLAAWGLVAVGWVVTQIASWPWSAVRCVTPSIAEIVLYYCLAGICLYWKRIPKPHIMAGFLLLLVGVDIGYWCHERFGRRELIVTAVDVGQGSASLLELPGGYTVLIDGGGFSDNSAFDVGARILAPLLWRQKIRTLDLVVLTHPNSDHLNGLLFLLQHFNVKSVWSNHEPADTMGYSRWISILEHRQIPHQDFKTLPQVVVKNGVRFEILAPPRDYLARRETENWRDLNNNSIVMRVCYGQISLLITGDIAAKAEADLLRRYTQNELASTLLMVPHHGSRKSSTLRFLSTVMAKDAVISAGWQNRFGFPHREVLDRLAVIGSRVWCTNESGAVRIMTDGKTYSIRTTR
jgi:competence protein ComEC